MLTNLKRLPNGEPHSIRAMDAPSEINRSWMEGGVEPPHSKVYFKLLIANEVAYFSGSAGSKVTPSKKVSGAELAPP